MFRQNPLLLVCIVQLLAVVVFFLQNINHEAQSVSFLLKQNKSLAMIVSVTLFIQYMSVLLYMNTLEVKGMDLGLSFDLLCICISLSVTGWLMVVLFDFADSNEWLYHYTGAGLFCVGYALLFPLVTFYHRCSRGLLYTFFCVTIVLLLLYVILFFEGHSVYAYICEWSALLFFSLTHVIFVLSLSI